MIRFTKCMIKLDGVYHSIYVSNRGERSIPLTQAITFIEEIVVC